MPPEYWLDANVLIESKKRWYRFDVVPGFWSFLDAQWQQGRLAAPIRVYEELAERSDDDLAQWAKERQGTPLFVEPSQEVQTLLREVAEYVENTYGNTKATRDFLDGADPWLVAYGRALGGTVITLEVGAIPGQTPKVKLPDVCEHFGVSWDSLFEMCQALGMRLG